MEARLFFRPRRAPPQENVVFASSARRNTLFFVIVGLVLGGVAVSDEAGAAALPDRASGGSRATFGAARGGSPAPLPANTKRVSRFVLSEPGGLSHLVAYLDGRGPGRGAFQRVRLVIYGDRGGRPNALLGRTKTHAIRRGSRARWVAVRLKHELRLPAGRYHLGLHSGGASRVARYGVLGRTLEMRTNVNAFRRGPSRRFGPVRAARGKVAVRARYRPLAQGAPPPPEAPPETSPSPAGANLWVDPNGGSCTRSPLRLQYADATACPSLDAANDACADGDLVLVKGGSYPAQTVSGSNARRTGCTVTVASDEPATVSGNLVLHGAGLLDVGGLTVFGSVIFPAHAVSTDVVVRDVTAFRFVIQGGTNVTIRGGSYGDPDGVDDRTTTADNHVSSKVEEFASVRPRGVTLDGVTLHDFYCLPADCHAECLFVYKTSNLTVKNSRFYNCDFYDIFFAGGDDDNVVIENNSFGQPYIPATNGTTRTPLYGRSTGVEWKQGGAYTNHLVRFNSFHPGTGLSFDGGSGSFARIVGNVMRRTTCAASATYRYNLMDAACDATDVAASVFGYTSTSPGLGFDPRLLPGAGAIDLVPASATGGCPPTDYAGTPRPRGLGCDAGAHERE